MRHVLRSFKPLINPGKRQRNREGFSMKNSFKGNNTFEKKFQSQFTFDKVKFSNLEILPF